MRLLFNSSLKDQIEKRPFHSLAVRLIGSGLSFQEKKIYTSVHDTGIYLLLI